MGTVFSWQGPQERTLKKALKSWGMFFLLWSYTASSQKASWRMRVPIVLTAAYDMAMPFPTRIPRVTQVCYWFSWYKKFNQQDVKQGSFQDKQTGDAAKLLLCWTKRKNPQAVAFRMINFSQTLLLLMQFLVLVWILTARIFYNTVSKSCFRDSTDHSLKRTRSILSETGGFCCPEVSGSW